MFCWERKLWTSWLLTCCSKKGRAAEKSSEKGVNRMEKCFLSSRTWWSWQNKRACTSFWTCSLHQDIGHLRENHLQAMHTNSLQATHTNATHFKPHSTHFKPHIQTHPHTHTHILTHKHPTHPPAHPHSHTNPHHTHPRMWVSMNSNQTPSHSLNLCRQHVERHSNTWEYHIMRGPHNMIYNVIYY